MSFENKKKIIVSSEYLSIDIDKESEDMIPHSEDPIKDMAKVYWRNNENGEPESTPIPESDDDNKIYLSEEKQFMIKFPKNTDETVKIFSYKSADGKEKIEMMTAKV